MWSTFMTSDPAERSETPGVCCWLRSSTATSQDGESDMEFFLWVLAVILVVSGIVAIVRKELLWGIVLIIVGLLVGPGGASIFT